VTDDTTPDVPDVPKVPDVPDVPDGGAEVRGWDDPDPRSMDSWADVPRIDSATTAASEPVASASAPAVASVPGPVSGGWVPPRRTRRRIGRRGLIGIVGGAVVLVLLVVAAVGGVAAGRVHYSPDRTVSAFLDQLSAGDVSAALAAGHVTVPKNDPLLTDTVYKSLKNRVTDYRIRSSQTSGDAARVTAVLKQGSHAVTTEFDLTSTGTAWGLFHEWRLDPVSLGAVDVTVEGPAGASVTIAGQKVTTSGQGTATLKALPGTYPVTGEGGSKWFTTASKSADVIGFGGTASNPIVLQTTLTAAGKTAATAAVTKWVDGCVASTDLEPSGCSFAAYGERSGETYSDRKWTLDGAPSFTIGGWTGQGWSVVTTKQGSVTFTEHIESAAGSGTGTAGPIAFSTDGLITGFSDSGATYRSLVSNTPSSSGS
jgi:hypothetical protein